MINEVMYSERKRMNHPHHFPLLAGSVKFLLIARGGHIGQTLDKYIPSGLLRYSADTSAILHVLYHIVIYTFRYKSHLLSDFNWLSPSDAAMARW